METGISIAGKPSKTKIISYWIVTIIFVIEGLNAGILQIVHVPHYVQLFVGLGYPDYFLVLLGIGKILGSIVLVIPRYPLIREWAYAGFMIDFLSAIFSHIAVGHGVVHLLGPLFGIALLVASYILRPDSLKLSCAVFSSRFKKSKIK